MAVAPPVLSLEGVTKRFGALLANDGIDLALRRGEVLALLGENGAGKTTLTSILFGHYRADAGRVRVAGPDGVLADLPPGSPRAALEAGIGMVHQHFALAESLTVLENVVLGTRPLASPRLRLGEARRRLAALMQESGLAVDPGARVAGLSVGEKQRVEILKVLYRGARVLVLDEPTAVLTPQQADGLFRTLRRLADKPGGLSVILISHKLDEVLRVADRVAVLRGGRKVADRPAAGADRATLAALMVGRDLKPPPPREAARAGEPVLVLDRVTVPGGETGRVGLAEVSLALRAGEVLGVAGVSGNGQAALAGLVAGTVRAASGGVAVAGRPLRATPRAAIRAGVARLPEDRQHEGVAGPLTIAETLALEALSSPSVQRLGILRARALRERARAAIAAYDVRCPGPDAPLRQLSGGNVQKVLLARVLEAEPAPRVVLANQPTRGLDVGAAADIHRRLLEARGRGAGVLLITEDLDELFALSDRIAVLAGGRLSAPVAAESLGVAQLGLLMAGEATPDARAA
jgi:general nucleoside transport system ATP-binding protein